MTAKNTELSTTYFTDKANHEYSVTVSECETASMTAYIVEVLDMMGSAAADETFCETFRSLEDARAYAQDYIDRNSVPSTSDETGKSMTYVTDRGECYRIEAAYGNLDGEKLGYYVWDRRGNTVHPPVGAWEPVKPFATLDDAKAYLDSIRKED